MPKYRVIYFYLTTSCQLYDAANYLKMPIELLLAKIYGKKPFDAVEFLSLYKKFFSNKFTIEQLKV